LSLIGWLGGLVTRRPAGPRALKRKSSVPDNLKTNLSDLRYLGTGSTVVAPQGSETGEPDARPLSSFQSAVLRRLEISAQCYRNRHGDPTRFVNLNKTSADLGIPKGHALQRCGIICVLKMFLAISPRSARYPDVCARPGPTS
jgi:hypothetical protein